MRSEHNSYKLRLQIINCEEIQQIDYMKIDKHKRIHIINKEMYRPS